MSLVGWIVLWAFVALVVVGCGFVALAFISWLVGERARGD